MNATQTANPPLHHADPICDIRTYAGLKPIYQFGRAVCRVATTLAFDLKAYDVHHVPRTGGVLVVANHQSFLDPALLGVPIRRSVSFLAKRELFEGHGPIGKAFGWLIRNLNAFPVRQGEGDVGAVRETIRRLQEGHVLTMFPEGGRSDSEQIGPMLGGVGLIVRRAGPTVKVVPAGIHGSFGAWSRHRRLPRPWPIRVKYGPAMDLANLKASQIVNIIDREIHRLYGELKNQNA